MSSAAGSMNNSNADLQMKVFTSSISKSALLFLNPPVFATYHCSLIGIKTVLKHRLNTVLIAFICTFFHCSFLFISFDK